MKSPFTGNEAQVKRKQIERLFRKESFLICEHFYIDEEGNEFSSTKLDELNTRQVHNLYKSKHHIPFPAEIKAIRMGYGLSAAKMAEVLDFGINSYRQYEAGEIPSLANAKLIRLAKNPDNFRAFLEEKKDIFSPNTYKKAIEKIDSLNQPDELKPLVEYLWNQDMEANAFTGFVKPNFEKAINYILFFVQKVEPLKTKLNKLLFYADFLNFQKNGYSISGFNYRAIKLGPVPSHYGELYGLLESQGIVEVEFELLDRGVGERFLPQQDFDSTLFEPAELENMERVARYFLNIKTSAIVEQSHQEEAWEANYKEKSLIDYQQHGFFLKAIES